MRGEQAEKRNKAFSFRTQNVGDTSCHSTTLLRATAASLAAASFSIMAVFLAGVLLASMSVAPAAATVAPVDNRNAACARDDDSGRINVINANAPGGNLAGQNLQGYVLRCVNFIGSNFSGANLAGVSFIYADLTGANFSGANLSHSFFGDAKLTGANLSNANLTGASFLKSDLTGASISGAILTSAHFQNSTGITVPGRGGGEVVPAPVASSSSVQQRWVPGWDLFQEPLGHRSKVVWSHTNGTNILDVKYVLRGARPFHDYQVGMHFFWGESDPSRMPNCPSSFGQFKTFHGGVRPFDSGCDFATRQGAVAGGRWVQNIELGVLHTDKNGNGNLAVRIKGVDAGVYNTEFTVRAGVGCYPPPEGNFAHCGVVFQSPGPFGKTTTIRIG